MKVSWKWLEDWVDLSGIEVAELAMRLNLAGIEVAGVTHVYDPKIVVGRIEAIDAHPKADKLVMCRVNVGGSELHHIACGAKNMSAGDLVPVALAGARPPGIDFEIVARPVAGVVSEGMLCAEDELGLSTESEGLWILPTDLAIGQNVFDATNTADVVIEVELTPNRADCLSHLGIARELAALFERALHDPENPAFETIDAVVDEVASLRVDDAQGCWRYNLAVLEGVRVGESPQWLRQRLAKVGMRTINNVVDVTNYVLLDVGQPLHAFDLDKLKGGIVVRRAQHGEELLGIDHKTHRLDERDLVIADRERAVAIAGVMGGEATEVTTATTRVAIECAQFQPTTVRKTAKRLGLHTESSHRFERGIDSRAVSSNLERAVALMATSQSEPANVRRGRITYEAHAIVDIHVEVTAARVNQILGTELSADACKALLDRLGIRSENHGDRIVSQVPSWRPDIERPIDLIEEIARIHGYDKLMPASPRIPMGHIHRPRKSPGHPPTIITRRHLRHARRARTTLLNAGLAEIMNYSFYGEAEHALLGLGPDDVRANPRRVANPLAADQGLMRTSLLPGLLKALATNVSRRQSRIALFEMGREYLPSGERERITGVVTGSRLGNIADLRDWDFYDVKGLVETLAAPFGGVDTWKVPDVLEAYLHPGVQAVGLLDGVLVATAGQLHPAVASSAGVDASVFYFDVDADALLDREVAQATYQVMPKFPAVERDFAFVADKSVAFAEFERAIRSVSSWLETISLFDLYSGPQVPEGKQSYAISVAYRSPERTLTEDDIREIDAKIVETVARETGARLR